MLISLKHRFVFLSNMKAASTTIETSLAPFAEIQRLYPRNSKHFTLSQMAEAFPAILSNPDIRARFVVFGVVRDPRDWILSWFNYRSRAQIADPGHHQHDQYCGHLDFSAFADAVTQAHPPAYAWVEPQYRFLTTNGQLDCDYVIDFDHFDADFDHLTRALGLGRGPDLMRLRNVTDHVRLQRDQVEWDAFAELNAFLAPDVALRAACRSRRATQLETVRDILAAPNVDDLARYAGRLRLMETAKRSVIASHLHGPTKGVTESDLCAQIDALDEQKMFQEIADDWLG